MISNLKKVLILFLSIILLFLIKNTYENKTNKINSTLEIHYIDVGQGNAILIKNKDKVLLLDGGPRKSSRYYYNYIKNKNINNIDYMVASHYDEDHIAGLISILRNFKVDNVLCPNYKKDSKIYKSFKKALKESNTNIIHPKAGYNFNLNDVKIKIISPNEYNSNKDNDNSIVIKIDFGQNSFLFPADISSFVENQLIYSGYNIKSNVLMLGHHGSKYSTSKSFIEEVNPNLAIISVGKNNRYKHPSKKVIKLLDDKKIKILRTDIDGNIILKSDGKDIHIKIENKNIKTK